MSRRRLVRRLEKAQKGNLGDIKPVGEGVFEMRVSMANKIEPFSVINIEPLFQRNCYLLSLDFSR
jgi:hypothetical protein